MVGQPSGERDDLFPALVKIMHGTGDARARDDAISSVGYAPERFAL